MNLRSFGSRWFASCARLGVMAAMIALSSSLLSTEACAQRRRFTGTVSHVDTSIALPRNGTVNVMASNGDIVVTGSQGDQVHVSARGDEGGGVRVQTSGSRIDVSAVRGDARLEISVPYGARVVTTAMSGDVTVRGTRGPVEVHAQSGDVQVDDVTTRLAVNSLSGDVTASNVTGDVAIESVSGDVRISDLRGDVDIGSVSGEIVLRGAGSRTVHARSTSGSIVYDGVIDPSGRYDLSSHSGDIRLRVQRDVNAQMSVSTWSGSVDSAFPMTLQPGEQRTGSSKAKALTFMIGNGGSARIIADTFSGDIDISTGGRGPNTRRP